MSLRPSTRWLVPLVALSLAACAGEAASGGADVTAEKSFVDISDPQGSVEGFVGALEDAEVDRCEATADGWIAGGTVANPTDAVQSYRLYVALNTNRDTHGLVQVNLDDVPGGAGENWEVEAPVRGDNLSCVLRVERFDPE